MPRRHDQLIPTQWKPGQSGNPKGRVARPSFETVIARVLDEKIPGQDMDKREALARIFVDEMLKRNGRMIREYLLRTWPVIQKHEVKTDGGMDVTELEAEISAVTGKGANGAADPRGTNGSGGSGS